MLDDTSKFKSEYWWKKSCGTLDSYVRINKSSPQKFTQSRWERKRKNCEKEKTDLYPLGFKPGVLLRLYKIQKALLDDRIPSILPILSATGTPTSKLAKICYQFLKPLTNN